MTTTKTQTKKTTAKAKHQPKGSVAYHLAKSLVSVAHHPHTGRVIRHHHTSHGALLIALLLTGVLLFSNLGALRAYGVMQGGSHTVTVNVAGAPPSVGADITFPATNTVTKSEQLQVRGTCPAGLLVATYNNGTFAGSSVCTTGGDYANTIQLVVGVNILQSQNYDGLNQPGPVTAQVIVTREQEPVIITPAEPVTPIVATTPEDVKPDPTRPVIVEPTPQPSTNPCFNESKDATFNPDAPVIIASCITRSISAGQTVKLPIRVTGGTLPYALSINWGDGITDLKSVLDREYHIYEHTYHTAGIVGVTLKTTDAAGVASFLNTVVEVNGKAPIGAAPTTFGNITSGLGSIWTEAPVPLYWAAVALVLGFWFGDIFQRMFAKDKKKPTKHKRRHA